MRVATGADEDDDIEALEVTFDQFSVWMKSSSPLADAYRQFLGGVVDDQLCAPRALPPHRGVGERRPVPDAHFRARSLGGSGRLER